MSQDQDDWEEKERKMAKSNVILKASPTEGRLFYTLGAEAGKSESMTPAGGENIFKSKWIWKATDETDEETQDGGIARYMSKQLEEHKDKPFFFAVGFRKPHTPWIAPKKYFDLYPPEKIILPHERGEPADDRKDIPEAAFNDFQDYQTISDQERKQAIAGYYACISSMDAALGVLLDTADRLKLWDNTVIVFMSDHGYHLGEHGGTARKETLFNECTHIPFLMSIPGGTKGAVCSAPIELVDLYPTFAEVCGLPRPEGVQGVSFAQLLKNPEAPWTRLPYSVVDRSKKGFGRSIVTPQYRYTEWDNAEKAEFYDLQKDPHEYNNLAKDPSVSKDLEEAKKLLHEAQQRPKSLAK